MINNRSILAVIPARGGSKRLPGKNIKLLEGKPLIAWSIEAAKKSKYIDRIILSTDDEKIAAVGREYGAEVPFMRPKELAGDTSTTVDAMIDLLNKIEHYDYLCLLQPTSPLRITADIDGAVDLCIEKKADSVISVCPCEHSPLWSNTLPEDHSLEKFIPEEIKNTRSQDLPEYYRINGAVYVVRIENLLKEKAFLTNEKCFAYVMPNERSVDIDNEIDFLLCQVIKEKSG